MPSSSSFLQREDELKALNKPPPRDVACSLNGCWCSHGNGSKKQTKSQRDLPTRKCSEVMPLCHRLGAGMPASEMRETAHVSNLADPVNETEEGRRERKKRKTNTASMCWQSRVVNACHFQDWLMASHYKLFRVVLQPLALKEETWCEVSRETPYDVVYSAVIF